MLHTSTEQDLPQPYRDRKRYAWILSLLVPTLVGFGPLLMVTSGDVRALWLPVAFFYLVAPLLDWIMGEDLSNPPESAVAALDADPFYRWITYLLVPVLWTAFVFSAWFVVHFDLPLHGQFAMVLIPVQSADFASIWGMNSAIKTQTWSAGWPR